MTTLKLKLIHWLLRLLSRLPLPAAQRAGTLLGRLAWFLAKRSRRTTEINIAACFPGLPGCEQKSLAKASLVETCKTALEIPLVWEWPVGRCLELVRETEGLELIDEVRKAGKGVLLLAPHLGNWELAGLYFSSRYNMAALYSPPALPEAEEYMVRVRGRLGSELVRGDRRGLARLIALLSDGGVAGILPDQSPRPKSGGFAPFFNIDVLTMTLASKLAWRSDARTLVTYAQRLPDSRGFRIVIREVEASFYSREMPESLAGLNASLEKAVRECPEQYQWEYKRFRRRPPGSPHLYDHGRIC